MRRSFPGHLLLLAFLLLPSAFPIYAAVDSSPAVSSTPASAAATAPASVPTILDKLYASWKEPVPPRRLVGNIYYVGAAGVSSFLIATPEGHILLDTGFPETVPVIERGVKQLGFRIGDIKIILSSHAHFDHVSGHATMKRLTGATIYASAADARLLASGGEADFIPLPHYDPIEADRILVDGDAVSLGGTTLIAHLTPGHTAGATTWTMTVTEGGHSYRVVFFSSTSINPGTRLIGNPVYPSISDDLAASFTYLKTLPCDIYFAPHATQFGMKEKFEKLDQPGVDNRDVHPLVDPEGWKKMIASSEKAYRDALALERASRP